MSWTYCLSVLTGQAALRNHAHPKFNIGNQGPVFEYTHGETRISRVALLQARYAPKISAESARKLRVAERESMRVGKLPQVCEVLTYRTTDSYAFIFRHSGMSLVRVR